jgi:hypothetical protein
MPWSVPILVWAALVLAVGLALAGAAVWRRRRCRSEAARSQLAHDAATAGGTAGILAALSLLPDLFNPAPAVDRSDPNAEPDSWDFTIATPTGHPEGPHDA